jgi:hydrogenase maturation protease
MKVIILGMGNTLLSDDGVGIVVVEELKKVIPKNHFIEIAETSWGGFRIIDLLAGFDKAIIVDSIKTGSKPPGTIHYFKPSDIVPSIRMVAFHDINFNTALEFAKQYGIPMPADISIYAIEVSDTETFSEKCTPFVQRAVKKCTKLILEELEKNMIQKEFRTRMVRGEGSYQHE